jgi:hypothetical protein
MAKPKMTDEKIRQFKAICRLNPTEKDCAAFLDVSEDTLENYCKTLKMTFSEFRTQNMVHTRFALIRKAIHMAENGNPAMLIFCLKNLCGWVDKVDNVNNMGGNIKIEISKAENEL